VNLLQRSVGVYIFYTHTHSALCLQLEGKISDLKVQNDTELAARDAQLARLKKQMAVSLTDSSR